MVFRGHPKILIESNSKDLSHVPSASTLAILVPRVTASVSNAHIRVITAC